MRQSFFLFCCLLIVLGDTGSFAGPPGISRESRTKQSGKPSTTNRIKPSSQKSDPIRREGLYGRGLAARCGNGTVEGSEECDDGNLVNDDGCSFRCAWEVWNAQHCGNGICEVNEDDCPGRDICRVDSKTGALTCRDCNLVCIQDCCVVGPLGVSCIPAPIHTIRCGDAVIEAMELCDDGNTVNGDGCNDFCMPETAVCGNGVLEGWSGETCDDANTNARDGCDPSCHLEVAVCGNSVVERWGGEWCDDGNATAGDGCSSSCRPERDRPRLTVRRDSGGGDSGGDGGGGSGGGGGCSDSLGSCCDVSASLSCPDDALRRDYLGVPLCSRCSSGRADYFTEGSAETCIVGGSSDRTFGRNGCSYGTCEGESCVSSYRFDSCQDSDGANTGEQGMVSGFSGGGAFFRMDTCEGTDRVREQQCGSVGAITYTCPSICVDGACVTAGSSATPSCLDSDPGDDSRRRGSIVGTRSSGSQYRFVDYCGVDGAVREYSCRPDGTGTFEERRTPCVEGEHCEGGVCRTAYSCRRIEPTSTTAGYVRGRDRRVQHDLCIGGEGRLVRFQCNTDGMPTPMETITCPSGCGDGVCL